MRLCGQKFEQPQKLSFYTVSKYKIILLTIYPNFLFYKALSGNTIL